MKRHLSIRWRETDAPQHLNLSRAAFRAQSVKRWSELEEFKHEFTVRLAVEECAIDLPPSILKRAVDEAWSLAALTPFPQLFLPELANEKVAAARVWSERQRKIYLSKSVAFAV